jgi:hypothetical protein
VIRIRTVEAAVARGLANQPAGFVGTLVQPNTVLVDKAGVPLVVHIGWPHVGRVRAAAEAAPTTFKKRANGQKPNAVTFGWQPRMPTYQQFGCGKAQIHETAPAVGAALEAAAADMAALLRQYVPEQAAQQAAMVEAVRPEYRLPGGLFTGGIVNAALSPGPPQLQRVVVGDGRSAERRGWWAPGGAGAGRDARLPGRFGGAVRRAAVLAWRDPTRGSRAARCAVVGRLVREARYVRVPGLGGRAGRCSAVSDKIRGGSGVNSDVYVISAGRPDAVARMAPHLEGVGPVWWIVPEQDCDAYAERGAQALADPGSLVGARNLALDRAFGHGQACVQVSDDLRRIRALPGQDWTLRQVIGDLDAALDATGLALAGCAPTANLYFAKPGIATWKFIVGDLIMVRPNELRFDPALRLKEDYDFTLQHITTHGGAARCDYIAPDFAHYTNAGGAVAVRTPEVEQEAIVYLMGKWPGLLRLNPRRPNEVLMTLRRAKVG